MEWELDIVFLHCGGVFSCMHIIGRLPVWCPCMAAGERQQLALW